MVEELHKLSELSPSAHSLDGIDTRDQSAEEHNFMLPMFVTQRPPVFRPKSSGGMVNLPADFFQDKLPTFNTDTSRPYLDMPNRKVEELYPEYSEATSHLSGTSSESADDSLYVNSLELSPHVERPERTDHMAPLYSGHLHSLPVWFENPRDGDTKPSQEHQDDYFKK